MKEIVDEVERWRERGEKVAIATVVATRRSAPRPVGAKFAVSETGKNVRVGLKRLRGERRHGAGAEVMASGEPRLLSYASATTRRSRIHVER